MGVGGWSCMSASEVMTDTVYRSEPQAQGGDYRPAVILQVLPELDAGGVERGTVDIARAIVDGGGKALVASQGGRLERELSRFGAQHITLPLKSKNILTMRKNIDALVKLIREEGVDIIHARSRAPAWSALLAARRTGRPFSPISCVGILITRATDHFHQSANTTCRLPTLQKRRERFFCTIPIGFRDGHIGLQKRCFTMGFVSIDERIHRISKDTSSLRN